MREGEGGAWSEAASGPGGAAISGGQNVSDGRQVISYRRTDTRILEGTGGSDISGEGGATSTFQEVLWQFERSKCPPPFLLDQPVREVKVIKRKLFNMTDFHRGRKPRRVCKLKKTIIYVKCNDNRLLLLSVDTCFVVSPKHVHMLPSMFCYIWKPVDI